GGTRAEQALEIVRQNPGVTIPELADRLGIKQNYLYRVMGGLEADGAVKKDGRGFNAA
ncbi:MAG: winged helix-turn-helix transcriptional regulator, partial [Thermoleophilaceae bacterium]|nr:winged helix-turn-helix transcriptional regulator [Thermoleophilaceae bacterium]